MPEGLFFDPIYGPADLTLEAVGSEPQVDCNKNCVEDSVDIVIGTSLDCNGNDIPDECEIANCTPESKDYPACDDCNLNAVPDGCDIDPADPDGNGEVSEDVDPADGVPDECVSAVASGNWTEDIWGLDGENPYPDNLNGAPDRHVTLDGAAHPESIEIFLDQTVEIDTLRLLNGATLRVTQEGTGDLTIAESGGILIRGQMYMANDRIIDAAVGTVTIGIGGAYQADPGATDVMALLSALSVSLLEGPPNEAARMILDDSMSVDVVEDLILDGRNFGVSRGKGSTTPPDLKVLGVSYLSVGGAFTILGAGGVECGSTIGMGLQGDFQNGSTLPLIFDWMDGGLDMVADGTPQLLEAAGNDVGPHPIGLHSNFSIGELTVAPDGDVTVVDTVDNQQDGTVACDEAVYVRSLVVDEGALFLSNGCRVYYEHLVNNGSIPGLNIDVLPICIGDVNLDHAVNAADLAQLLGSWGECVDCARCTTDLNADCVVNAFDLATLLGNWGSCAG